MRQFQVRDEAGGLDVVAVHQHKLFLLRRAFDLLVVLARTQRTVDQGHAHGLALGIAEGQAVTAGELRLLGTLANELVDHLALGHLDITQRYGKTEFFRLQPDLDLADANLPGKGVIAAVTALSGIAQR